MKSWKEQINQFANSVSAENRPSLIGAKVNSDNCFSLNNRLLVVKVSLIGKPWWGLHTDAADKLNAENGHLVLLDSLNAGWTLPASEVTRRIENGTWHLASDHVQYKIHPRDLPSDRHFGTPQEFLEITAR